MLLPHNSHQRNQESPSTMGTTPPSKRHHLPYNVSPSKKPVLNGGSSTVSRSKVQHIFLTTCAVALCIQVAISVLTLHNHNHASTTSHPTLLDRRRMRQLHAQNFNSNEKMQFGASPHNGRLRVLMGILTADFFNDQVYRKRHRALFKLWNDKRVCSLAAFKAKPLAERYECELIYVFVLGGNPNASPELVDGSRPMEVARPVQGKTNDLNEPDMILLNIRENMNEGKSQTWMHYGAQIAEEYDLDYVSKCDADSMLHLHDFFRFAYKHLPPAPYNSMMYVGALRDKAYWPKHETEQERIRFESYFGNNFEGVHLYVAGQIYIVSTDLARYIGKEALEGKCSYCEGHEDHDISAMAFHSPEPVKLVVIGRRMRFWEHPVKGEPRWRRIWAREQARMAGVPFEGKLFSTESDLLSGVPLGQ